MVAICKGCDFVLKCLSGNFKVYIYECPDCASIHVTAWYYANAGGTSVYVTSQIRACPKKTKVEDWLYRCRQCKNLFVSGTGKDKK